MNRYAHLPEENEISLHKKLLSKKKNLYAKKKKLIFVKKWSNTVCGFWISKALASHNSKSKCCKELTSFFFALATQSAFEFVC